MTDLLTNPDRLRSITLIDGGDSPLHITSHILLNDRPVALRLPGRDLNDQVQMQWSATGGTARELVVGLTLHPDDVTFGEANDDGTVRQQYAIAGHPVLVPVDRQWTRITLDAPAHAFPTRADGQISYYIDRAEPDVTEWVTVYAQIDSLQVIHR